MHKATAMIGGAAAAAVGAVSMYVAMKPKLRRNLLRSHSASEAFNVLTTEMERDAFGVGERAVDMSHGAIRQFSRSVKSQPKAVKRSHHKKQPSHPRHHAAKKTAASMK